jgi:two-component system, LytTR family, response regulator
LKRSVSKIPAYPGTICIVPGYKPASSYLQLSAQSLEFSISPPAIARSSTAANFFLSRTSITATGAGILIGDQSFVATQLSAYASLGSKHSGIRVALCEPDPTTRAQVRSAIENDPLLVLAGESQNWDECEACLDSVVPELLIIRSELIPADWSRRGSEHFQPVVIPLRTTLTFPNPERNDLHVPANPQTIRAAFDRAVRDIYDRKAKQLLFLVDRYVAGSQSLATYKTFIQAECDGHPIDLAVGSIVSIVAARKHVTVHTTTGGFLLREPIHRVAGDLDPAMFVRIHRSIIVNVRHVNRAMPLGGKPFEVILNDGSGYRVGPNYRDALADALGLREQS